MLRIRWMLGATALVVLLAGTVPGPAAALEVGQKAPEFALPAAPGGAPVKLSELTAKGPVVVYTFIQAFTAT
jgi:hypothetical protein